MSNNLVSNPFAYGRPITEPARFVGRQQEARQIFSRLGNMESSAILGERRIGKTSFLKYVSHADTVRKFGHDPEKYLFVFVDLQGHGRQETPNSFWRDILDEIEAQAKDDRIRSAIVETRTHPSLGTRELGDLLDGIGQQGQRVVLLLDEFENVTNNPNFDLDFFNNLRSLAIHHNLALITSSRQELAEFCYSREVASSPFFNIFANIDLGLFTTGETNELMDKALAVTPVSFDQAEREYLQQMTGRHPFFLVIACHFLLDAYVQHLNEGERRNVTIQALRRQATSHFSYYWRHSNEDEQITLTALALLHKAQRKREFDIEELKSVASRSDRVLRGLTRRALLLETGGRYALFSPLFGEWIIGEVFDPQGQPDQTFKTWLQAIKSKEESSKALEQINKRREATNTLSKVKPKYRGLIKKWLHHESFGNVTRLLLIAVEVIRVLAEIRVF